jgi:hypothetical protein
MLGQPFSGRQFLAEPLALAEGVYMKQRTRRFGVLAVAFGLVAATGAAAGAVTITAPSSSPFSVPGDGAGNPQFFTVTATGFTQNEAVYVQQCDGVSSSSPGYTVGEHCDLASGNSPVNANASGAATFSASDSNQRLNVFKGSSPQGLFNCLSPNDPSPANGQPDFRNCQVRVSGGTPGDTTEQAFFTIVLPDAVTTATPVGACMGQALLGTFFNSTGTAAPLSDVTQIGVTVKTKLLKDLSTKTAIAGDCSAAVRPGDGIHPTGGLVSPLTPKAVAAKLVGNASCATTANDPNAAAAWPLNGKITWTMTQLNALAKPYQIQASVAILGFDPAGPDVVDVGGIVLKGVAVGANVSGSLWQDPVTKTGGTNGYNTGYELDLAGAASCADATPNNANVAQVLIGGGAGTATSLLGSTASGISFSLGQ